MKTTLSSFVKQQTILVFALFLTDFLMSFSGTLSAQPLFEENIAPSPNIPEDAWDGKQIPTTPNFVMLSNTMQYGRDLIALTILNPMGAIIQRTVVWDVPNTTAALYGAAVDVDLNTAGMPAGFFITGTRLINGLSEMIVIRTDMAGFPTWTQSLPVFNAAGLVQFRDAGVSLERQPNGDVVAIGKSMDLSGNLSQMIAARFTAGGALVWSRRYRTGNSPGSIIPAESCNGMAGNPLVQVVAVTGAYVTGLAPGVTHTFASCINAATGTELWRCTYNSGLASDEGYDIVQKPTSGPFMIVGKASTAAGPANLWILNVTASTGALPAGASTYYTTGVGDIVGRDVCLNSLGNRALIAGMLDRPVAGTFTLNAFLMQISFGNCASPNWTKVYTASTPNTAGTESVNQVVVAGPNVAGYILTTDGLPQSWGGATQAAHPIYVDVAGNHPYGGDCPIVNMTVTKTCAGTRTNLQKPKVNYPWMPIALNWEILVNAMAICDGVLPAPLAGSEDRNENDPVIEITPGVKVSPNPAAAGENLQIVLEGYAESITLSLFDMTGRKLIENDLGFDPEGESISYALPTENLAGGTYILQVRSGQKLNTVKIVIR